MRGTRLPIYRIAHGGPRRQSHEDGQRHALRGTREADAGDEDDALDALAQHGDEGHEEQGVLLAPALEARPLDGVLLLERLGDLDAPLLLQLRDAQQRGAQDRDDDGGEEPEGALPVVLGRGPGVAAEAVEGADQAAADDEADDEADDGAEPDLGVSGDGHSGGLEERGGIYGGSWLTWRTSFL